VYSTVTKIAFWFFVSITLAGLIWVYKTHNPAHGNFPKCPFRFFTGYLCPGCGSQRAVHMILNGRFQEAFFQNQLLLISIPYILLGYFFEAAGNRFLVIRRFLYGPLAIKVILVIVTTFWVGRNLV
jgi:Protein of unknown function (DUF2752)